MQKGVVCVVEGARDPVEEEDNGLDSVAPLFCAHTEVCASSSVRWQVGRQVSRQTRKMGAGCWVIAPELPHLILPSSRSLISSRSSLRPPDAPSLHVFSAPAPMPFLTPYRICRCVRQE